MHQQLVSYHDHYGTVPRLRQGAFVHQHGHRVLLPLSCDFTVTIFQELSSLVQHYFSQRACRKYESLVNRQSFLVALASRRCQQGSITLWTLNTASRNRKCPADSIDHPHQLFCRSRQPRLPGLCAMTDLGPASHRLFGHYERDLWTLYA